MKIRQFLVHSFLYYQLDDSIIDDNKYDTLVTELKELVKNKNDYIYESVIKDSLGAEGSGFSIKRKQYPPEIISTSLHLLYQERYKERKPLNEFLASFGYGIKEFAC